MVEPTPLIPCTALPGTAPGDDVRALEALEPVVRNAASSLNAFALLIAMLVLVVVAGAVAAHRVPHLAAKTALVAIITATLAALGFLGTLNVMNPVVTT